MKKTLILASVFLIVSVIEIQTAAAQFPIKIPKISKPKVEPPKPTEQQPPAEQPNTDGANKNPAMKSKDEVTHMPKPYPTNVPVLLKDSFNIKISWDNRYWKFPNVRNYTSWIPLIQFDLFFDKSETVRYTIEWLNPDGSLWFSQTVDDLQTRRPNEIFDTKATDAAGTYGFRLLNTKTKEVVFQGKFKVKKMDLSGGDPSAKNTAAFYVDQDWSLPIGYVGFEWNTSWDYDPQPTVYMWFKGDLKAEDFEARLFHNNQQITSTDDGGSIVETSGLLGERNPDSCFQNTEVCRYTLWQFRWKNFRVESFDKVAHKNNSGYGRAEPNAVYTKDKPGEYTVKIFHKGMQVRETKFTVQSNGWLAPNSFAAQVPLSNYKAIIPVKIMGTLDKWNPAAWKTDAFYGNPLTGFNVP